MDESSLDVPLSTKLSFLSQPGSYPGHVQRVEMVETHMSCVFLTEAYAYKLKKPVRFEFLDFSTLELRRRDCEDELRLNRRLAPDVYLGLSALTLASGGGLALDGAGQPVEWLVKMRRLPQTRMLDFMIPAGTLRSGQIQEVAALLAKFYAAAAPIPTDPAAYRRRFEEDIRANRREMILYGLSDEVVDRVATAQLAFLERERELVESRARERRIIDAHGDLRPEHIHIGPPPCIIDCLEFNADFRRLDPVDEICFLTMECERLGAAFIGENVLAAYAAATNDRPVDRLVIFYKCFRACLRAKIVIWHLRDPDVLDPGKWRRLAQIYLRMAEAYARQLAPVSAA
jgi:aminoglycoside phosphotransferase family enzyme